MTFSLSTLLVDGVATGCATIGARTYRLADLGAPPGSSLPSSHVS